MRNLHILQSLGSVAACVALGVTLLGADLGDATTPADSQFAHSAMNVLLISVSNATAAESSGDAQVKNLANNVQSDELAIGSQLASLASYYGITLSTDAPKATTDGSGYAADQAHQLQTLIVLFQSEKDGGGGAQMRAFAGQSIPILQKDLQAVQAAQ
jgi:predicted outer membrane protein